MSYNFKKIVKSIFKSKNQETYCIVSWFYHIEKLKIISWGLCHDIVAIIYD